MLTKKAHLDFKLSLFKVRCTHKRLMKVRLRILKLCLHKVVKIGIPKNNEENETLKRIIAFYDETIQDLNKDIDRCRKYVWD